MSRRTIRVVAWLVISLISGWAGTMEISGRSGRIPDSSTWRAERRAMEVYRRGGCGDWKLARMTVEWAGRRGVPERVVAAQVVVESECNPRAISRDGSIGLMQVRVATWRREFRFRDSEMLDAGRSLEVGTEILRRQVARYGLRKGIERYNGCGQKARKYAKRVMRLAGAGEN